MNAAGRSSRDAALTTWSVVALAAGLLLGVLGHALRSPGFGALADAVKPIGEIWVAALQMTVLPLVIIMVLAAVVSPRGHDMVAALGSRAVFLFIAMLTVAGLFTLALAPAIIARYSVDPAAIASLQAATPVPESAREAAAAGPGSLSDWFAGLLPTNVFEAALRGDILTLLLVALVFGIAVTRLPDEYRDPLTRLFRGSAEATLQVVRWILWGTPPAVFALGYATALEAGDFAAEVLAAFVVIVSGLMVLFTVLLYPISAVLGRTTIRTFARAVAPAQLVAVSTRSSIAALPALVEGGGNHLRLPGSATSFVLPLSVSVFKVNRTISSLTKLLFVGHVYGVPLGPDAVAAFFLTVIILSFTTAGVPYGGTAFKTLPAYLAAGLPIEGIVILEAVEAIPDIFKTVLNVTGDMSVATLLSRSSRPWRRPLPATREPQPATDTG
jgi:proton glutamate symport protein